MAVVDVVDDGRILGNRDGVAGFWDGSGDFASLMSLFASLGIDLGEFDQSISALDISSDGNLVLGSSRNASGSQQYWIANLVPIPEPGTGLLLGLGLALIARYRGRLA